MNKFQTLILTLTFSLFTFITFGQNYCTQAQSLTINAPGTCNFTSISPGADFDNQDDNAGDVDITLTTSCTTPSGSWNVYWGTFVGNGNAVTIKLLNPSNDATMVVFENTPCGGNMTETACDDIVSDGAGGIVLSTTNGLNYTIAIYRQSGSSSLTAGVSIVDNPSNTPYFAPCDACVNGTPQCLEYIA